MRAPLERETPRLPCLRCGVRVTTGGRTGPVVVCTDCQDVDPAYAAILIGAVA